MIEFLHEILSFIRNLGLILKNPIGLSAQKRDDLLRTYLRIKIKHVFLRNLFKSEAIFGKKISFVKYSIFVAYFEEIFVQNEYYFKSKTTAPVIIDFGAYTGEEIFYFKWLYPKCKILAFEVERNIFQILKKNVDGNAFSGVELFNVKVDGRINFDEIFRKKVDFVKMDIEGAEKEVINTLSKKGMIRKVDQMIIEYHHHKNSNEEGLGAFLNVLSNNNFGYQITSPLKTPFQKAIFQDIIICTYRK